MDESLIGVDIGTSACKATLLRVRDGMVLGSASQGYEPDVPQPGWSEQDPRVWYRAVVGAIARLLADEPDVAGTVLGLGITGQMRGVVLVDDAGHPVRPAILWNDNRCQGEVESIAGDDLVRLEAITHNVLNTMCTLPKLLWLQGHEPSAVAATRTLLYPKDYVRLCLTDERATDLSDAAGSSIFDVASQAWSDELLERFEIPRAILPKVLRATDIAGGLTATAAADTGLPAGTPVVIGGSDSTVESFSVGLTDERACKVRLGTSGAVSTVVDDITDSGRAYVWSYVRDDRWMLDTNTRACGQAVRWLRQLAYSEIGDDETAFAAIDREAAGVGLGAEGLLFHPYLLGEDAPYWDPSLRGSLHGLDAHHRRPQLARAVLEGTAFALRDAMSTLGHWATGFDRCIYVGGGTMSPTWLRIVCDVLAMDGEVPAAADASLGAAMLAGVGVGCFDDLETSVRRCYRVRERIAYAPEVSVRYDELNERYLQERPSRAVPA
jgi:xylulokinase